MLSKLSIKNFKCIEKQEFDFKNITILTGLNSTGKSTIIQSILLLSSRHSENETLSNYVNKFGSFSDIKNKYIREDSINLSVLDEENNSYSIKFASENVYNLDKKRMNILNFEDNFFYISSNRIGQEEIALYSDGIKFGLEGQYVFGYFEKNKDKPILDTLVRYDIHQTLDAQLSFWLRYILGIELRVLTQKISSTNVIVKFNTDGLENISPFNLGAGNSYLAKILIMGLSCIKGNILIIENPEIHLHPKAQSRLSDFFVMLANAGIQVIIETHSEHLINKLRHNIYKNEISQDDTIIYYKPSIRDDFITINIDKNGHYVDEENKKIAFPQGFFDSTLDELLEIM